MRWETKQQPTQPPNLKSFDDSPAAACESAFRSTRGVLCAMHQPMRKTAAILFAVVLAMLTTSLQLPAASCILSNGPSHEACKSNCCANMTCCAMSEKNTGSASQPLAQNGAAKQQVPDVVAATPSSSLQPLGVAPIVYATIPVRAHSPPPLAASCIRLI